MGGSIKLRELVVLGFTALAAVFLLWGVQGPEDQYPLRDLKSMEWLEAWLSWCLSFVAVIKYCDKDNV